MDILNSLSWQAEQAVIDRVRDLTDYKQVMLAQEIIDIVDASSLRVLHRHQAKINLARSHRAKDIGKRPIGHRLYLSSRKMSFPSSTKIGARGLIAKGSSLPLKGNLDLRTRSLRLLLFLLLLAILHLDLLCHNSTLPFYTQRRPCSHYNGAVHLSPVNLTTHQK